MLTARSLTEQYTKGWLVLKHFLLNGNYSQKIKQHLSIIQALKPFKQQHLIFFRSNFTYILPYLSWRFTLHQRNELLINHYSFLVRTFSAQQLQQLFTTGMICYHQTLGTDKFTIDLQAVTGHLEFEGSMCLLFKVDKDVLYSLKFSFVPGRIFEQDEMEVIYISSIQGAKNEYQRIRRAAKYFKDNAPPVILMKVLEVIARQIGIKIAIGICAKNQLSCQNTSQLEAFYNSYDHFWTSLGAVQYDDDYRICFPLFHKPITSIGQSHRNRTLKKRAKLQEILEVATAITNDIFHPNYISKPKS